MMKVIKVNDKQEGYHYVSIELLKNIQYSKSINLGLATGGTMEDLYKCLNNMIHINNVNMNHVRTFNLDEYIGIEKNHKQSYYTYMYQHFFKHHPSLNSNKLHLPNGDAKDLNLEALKYENNINNYGPIDIQILGIGENGHIGFNEPGTCFTSKTRVVDLEKTTIQANSRYFKNINEVPRQAITMGIDTILKAKRIILLAFGENKREAINKLLDGEVSTLFPASILHEHIHVEVITDLKV